MPLAGPAEATSAPCMRRHKAKTNYDVRSCTPTYSGKHGFKGRHFSPQIRRAAGRRAYEVSPGGFFLVEVQFQGRHDWSFHNVQRHSTTPDDNGPSREKTDAVDRFERANARWLRARAALNDPDLPADEEAVGRRPTTGP